MKSTASVFVYLVIAICLVYDVIGENNCSCKCPESKEPTKVEVKVIDTTVQNTADKIKSASKEPYHNIRLPKTITPRHYNVFLDLNMPTKLVNGNVTINISVLHKTKYVILHGLDYLTLNGRLYDEESNEILSLRQFDYKENQYHVMEFGDDIGTGSYVLKYDFSYKLNKNLVGFYEASYTTSSGEEKDGAFTQFQATDARRAFPCFDEPALRATFDITLGHEKKYIAISNMPVIKTSYDATKTIRYNTFSRTPSMPTYLLAFAVCEFGKITTIAKTRTPVKMSFYAPPDQLERIKYAANAGGKVLAFFEEYYNVSYPLPKADMIAVPDFAAGAMENWGLITYRMKALLYDEELSSSSTMTSVALYITHELAHMWFGNLVTMEWWSDLWLNEGFASYVEYLGTKAIHPEWKFEEFQTIYDMKTAMRLDALVTSHPIYIEVNSPDEIGEIFDRISYSKGACVLRMLDNFMGTENFVKGINAYLRKYSYGNAKTEDLWTELTKVSHLSGDNHNISRIMNTWVLQMGFPVINVTRFENGVYRLSQSRFLSEKNPNMSQEEFKSPYGYKWYVPFNYVTLKRDENSNLVKGPVKRMLLNMTGATITTTSDNFILKGNAGQFGYYRVNYDKEGWQKIISIMKENHLVFDVTDRVGLLQDAFALASSGRLEYHVALELFDYIDKETDYLPWSAAMSSISSVAGRLSLYKETRTLMEEYLRRKVSSLYNKYKFSDVKGFRERKLQRLIVSRACLNKHQGCLDHAKELYKEWMKGKPIPKEFLSLVLYYGVYNGGEKEWQYALDQYLNTTVPSLRASLLYTICATQEPRIIDRILHFAFDHKIVKKQDAIFIFAYVARQTTHGRYHAWYFLKENWDVFAERLPEKYMRSMAGSVISGFNSEHSMDQVKKFFNEKRAKKGSPLRRTITKSLDKIKESMEWLKTHREVAENWLKSKLE